MRGLVFVDKDFPDDSQHCYHSVNEYSFVVVILLCVINEDVDCHNV